MQPAELEEVAARHGLSMAEVNERCEQPSAWDCEDFRDWWARMADIRKQSEADRRSDVSRGWEHAARQILLAAELFGIRGLADEAMQVIAAELGRTPGRPMRNR